MRKKYMIEEILMLIVLSASIGCNSKSGTIPTDEKYHEGCDAQYNFRVNALEQSYVSKTENGFYCSDDVNVRYVEDADLESIVLCNKAGCVHGNTDGCGALIDGMVKNIQEYEERIYFLNYNNVSSLISEREDGSDRTTEMVFYDYDIIKNYIIHRGKMLFIYQNVTNEVNESGIVYNTGIASLDLNTKKIVNLLPDNNMTETKDVYYDCLWGYGNNIYIYCEDNGESVFKKFNMSSEAIEDIKFDSDYQPYDIRWSDDKSIFWQSTQYEDGVNLLIKSDFDGKNVEKIAKTDTDRSIYTNGEYIVTQNLFDKSVEIFDMNMNKIRNSDVANGELNVIGFYENKAYFATNGSNIVRILDLEHPEGYIEIQ